MLLGIDLTHKCANNKVVIIYSAEVALVTAIDRNQDLRSRQPQVHERDKALPTRENPGVLSVLGHGFNHRLERRRGKEGK